MSQKLKPFNFRHVTSKLKFFPNNTHIHLDLYYDFVNEEISLIQL